MAAPAAIFFILTTTNLKSACPEEAQRNRGNF
jgi:hypothetical protein